MATITLNPTGQSTLAHAVSGGSNYAVLADSSDSSYIYAKATGSEVTTTSIFQMGSSSSIAGRFVVTGISTMIRNKNGASGMNTSSMAANLYVGGIEGRSWGNSLGTSWTDRTHTSGVNEFSVLDGKLLTSLPQILLHIASVLKVSKTGDDKWNGASKASVTLTYDNYYVQSAQGSTGVTASVSNNTTAVSGYYKSGSISTYSATLGSGYGFKGWFTNQNGTGTPVSTSLTYQETCGSDRVLYAFTYKLTLVGDSNITLSATLFNDGTGQIFEIDGQYRYTDSPLTKCYCSSFLVNEHKTYNNFTFPMPVRITEDTVIKVTTLIVSLEGDTGISSLSLDKDGECGIVADCTLHPGYDFTGWHIGGDTYSANPLTLFAYHWPSSSIIITARTSHHSYSLNAVADAHCTASVSSPDHYYGTTATFTAAVTDNQYTFAGWYEDPSFTTLYSTALVTSYVITGDKTLYAKTIPLNKFFLKVGNTWKTISKVFRKTNNVWVEVSISDYTDLFDTQQPYLKDDNREH